MTETCFCPECGSPRVDTSKLVGGTCNCRACKWSGSSEKLYRYEYDTNLLEGSDVITRFSTELRSFIAKKMSVDIGRFLVTWGFLPEKDIDVQVLARYLNAIARAVGVAIIQTREEIEEGR